MVTDVQVCNIALARIKGQPISDLETDDSTSAVYCRTFYEPARDAVLREHPWGFAVTRQSMAQSAEINKTAYGFMYQMPTDPRCLRPLGLITMDFYDSACSFKVEGKYLYTDEMSPILRYIAQVTDPTLFDALFINAFAWRLAAELVIPLNGDSASEPWAMYERSLLKAAGIDELSKVEAPLPSGNWTDNRF